MRTLQEEFGDENFRVLGFPCNQFGAQEPGTESEILAFAKNKYDVNFTLFEKIEVNGAKACELYQWLKSAKQDEDGSEDIPWNFAKFIVDGDGSVQARFAPQTAPEELRPLIASLLN